MGTSELKSNLHKLIDTIQDGKTLTIIYSLISNSFSNPQLSLTSAEKNAADKGLDSIAKGNIHKHEDVLSEMKKKYPNLHK